MFVASVGGGQVYLNFRLPISGTTEETAVGRGKVLVFTKDCTRALCYNRHNVSVATTNTYVALLIIKYNTVYPDLQLCRP